MWTMKDFLLNNKTFEKEKVFSLVIILLNEKGSWNGKIFEEEKGFWTRKIISSWKKQQPFLLHQYSAPFYRKSQTVHFVYEAKGRNIWDQRQKEFVPGMSGCVENAATSHTIINDAGWNGNELFMLLLVLKEAFDLVSHDLISYGKFRFSRKIPQIISDSHKNITINIQTEDGSPDC